MTDNFKEIVPTGKNRNDLNVRRSRFIGSLAHVPSVDEARAFIRTIQKEFPDASHHVPAFIIGHGATQVTHCSDAGEPSGSAGRPILAVLQGSGLGDVVVVITRYFGGTKLGIGGLVRAYGDSVRDLIANTKRAQKVRAMNVTINYDYPFVDRIRSMVVANSGQIKAESFEVNVMMTANLPVSILEDFEDKLSELTNGTANMTKMEFVDVLVPLGAG
jgi:uncharacterized YigZ family protein